MQIFIKKCFFFSGLSSETRFAFLKTDDVCPAKKKVLSKMLPKNHPTFDQI